MLWRGALAVAVLLVCDKRFAQPPVLRFVHFFCKDGRVSGIPAATET